MSDPRVLAAVAELLGERAPKGKRALGYGSGVQVRLATTEDADPVRARIARAREERSARARQAARARHHEREEPECPNFEDYDAIREKLSQQSTPTRPRVSRFASAWASSMRASATASSPQSEAAKASPTQSPVRDSTKTKIRRLRSQTPFTEQARAQGVAA
jgi:hypothetical protein